LIKITDCRLPFASQVVQLRRQRQWLIDLEHLLDPPEKPDQPLLTLPVRVLPKLLIDI
jgi:hypothetical protein